MGSVIAGLKWLAKFLERRFPEKLDITKFALKEELVKYEARVAELEKSNTSLKEQVQTLNIRVGLQRPIQTVLRGK